MKTIGMWMAILGGGSFLLNMMGREFVLISWIDNWGPDVGIGIRVGMIVVGAILFFVGLKQENAAVQES
ncbi:MAG: hypothetical protein AAAFM81_04550 [Pseudomonadota bacterium]